MNQQTRQKLIALMLDISVYLTDHCPTCGFCVRNQHEDVLISLFMQYLVVLINMLI